MPWIHYLSTKNKTVVKCWMPDQKKPALGNWNSRLIPEHRYKILPKFPFLQTTHLSLSLCNSKPTHPPSPIACSQSSGSLKEPWLYDYHHYQPPLFHNMSKPWGGGIGAWAADSERAEAEERELQLAAAAATVNNKHPGAESQSFPSLKEAASKPKKKNKPIPLSEFATGTYVGPGGGGKRDFAFESKGLTTEELFRLPTGPKERSADELEHGRLGGGFRSYGRTPAGRDRERLPENEGSWSGGRKPFGGFDEERRGGARVSDFDQPSRADEVDNWASMKKPAVSLPDSGRRDRYASLGSGSSGVSRADDVDNWAAVKKPLPARSVGLGSNFGDSGFDNDRWSRDSDRDRERPRLVLDRPRGGAAAAPEVARARPSPFGSARPREEVLMEKGLDWKKMDSEYESKKSSRPTSSQSSRPSSAQSSRPESPAAPALAQPRPRVNPFGDAKPREVLLEEQGKDWRKIDLELEHRGVDRPEAAEEKLLKDEINQLKRDLAKEVEVNPEYAESSDEVLGLREQISIKERDLEVLIREFDDKVRFGQRGSERPGSGAGRFGGSGFADRPPSRSSLPEDLRDTEVVERPRSRAMADVWSKSGDDGTGGFGSNRERGFVSSRDDDRFKSRVRW